MTGRYTNLEELALSAREDSRGATLKEDQDWACSPAGYDNEQEIDDYEQQYQGV